MNLPVEQTNGHDPHDFAPPSDPDRMKRITELTGQTIRHACSEAGKAVMKAVEEAEQEITALYKQGMADLAQVKQNALEFNDEMGHCGEYHASSIEQTLTRIQGIHAIRAVMRKHITELTEGYADMVQTDAEPAKVVQ